MNEIFFYEKENGDSPVRDYLQKLSQRQDKKSASELKQLRRYIDYLSQNGLSQPESIMKRLDAKEKIWELRPDKNRILFFHWGNKKFVLLHIFRKKTQKTPPSEIDSAIREKKDYLNRVEDRV